MTEIVQCVGCGVERARNGLPEFCPICADERQYLPADGVQLWTTPAASAAGATLAVDAVEPGVWGIVIHNGCGIGQRPLLVATAVGNVMIEVPAHIDADAVDRVRALGGVAGIIASHPHMYGVQSLWSEAFGDAPCTCRAPTRTGSGRSRRPLRLRPPVRQLRRGGAARRQGCRVRSAERYAAWASGEYDHLT